LTTNPSPTTLEDIESLTMDIDMMFHDLPLLSEDDWDKLDEWQKAEIIEAEVCPFCHGLIATYPITDVNYKVECEQCGRIYEEE